MRWFLLLHRDSAAVSSASSPHHLQKSFISVLRVTSESSPDTDLSRLAAWSASKLGAFPLQEHGEREGKKGRNLFFKCSYPYLQERRVWQNALVFLSSAPQHWAHPRRRSKVTAHTERGQASRADCAAAELQCLFQSLRIWSEAALHWENVKEGPHTQSQQRDSSARACQDNVPGAQPPQPAGAMCCQPIACQAEEEPKPQQFLYRQSWHVPQTAFHPPHPPAMPLRPWWGAGSAWPHPTSSWKSCGLLLGTKVPCSSSQIFKAAGTWAGAQV